MIARRIRNWLHGECRKEASELREKVSALSSKLATAHCEVKSYRITSRKLVLANEYIENLERSNQDLRNRKAALKGLLNEAREARDADSK